MIGRRVIGIDRRQTHRAVMSGMLKNTLLWQAMDGLREDQAR